MKGTIVVDEAREKLVLRSVLFRCYREDKEYWRLVTGSLDSLWITAFRHYDDAGWNLGVRNLGPDAPEESRIPISLNEVSFNGVEWAWKRHGAEVLGAYIDELWRVVGDELRLRNRADKTPARWAAVGLHADVLRAVSAPEAQGDVHDDLLTVATAFRDDASPEELLRLCASPVHSFSFGDYQTARLELSVSAAEGSFRLMREGELRHSLPTRLPAQHPVRFDPLGEYRRQVHEAVDVWLNEQRERIQHPAGTRYRYPKGLLADFERTRTLQRYLLHRETADAHVANGAASPKAGREAVRALAHRLDLDLPHKGSGRPRHS